MTSLPDALGEKCPVGFREMWQTCIDAAPDDEAPWLVLADACVEWGMQYLATVCRLDSMVTQDREDPYWINLQYAATEGLWFISKWDEARGWSHDRAHAGLYELLTGQDTCLRAAA